MAKAEKQLDLQATLKALEKDYGKGSVMGGGDTESYSDVISTGSIGLDAALGIGGLPVGKMVEFMGWESSGKSTIVLHVIAEAQKKGIKCLLVDGENSFDANYAATIGVDVNALYIVQIDGDGGEKCYDIAERLIKTGEIGLVVYDSQNSLQPKSVLDNPVEAASMGHHSRMLGKAVMKMNTLVGQYPVLIIWISQLREKIGVMFGSPETTQGGNALRFYCQMRLDFRKTILRENKEADPHANDTTVKVIKNKLARPFRKAKFEIAFGIGIDKMQELLKLGKETGVLKLHGGKVTYGEEKYLVGVFIDLLESNSDLHEEIRTKIIDIIKDNADETITTEDENQQDDGTTGVPTEEAGV